MESSESKKTYKSHSSNDSEDEKTHIIYQNINDTQQATPQEKERPLSPKQPEAQKPQIHKIQEPPQKIESINQLEKNTDLPMIKEDKKSSESKSKGDTFPLSEDRQDFVDLKSTPSKKDEEIYKNAPKKFQVRKYVPEEEGEEKQVESLEADSEKKDLAEKFN